MTGSASFRAGEIPVFVDAVEDGGSIRPGAIPALLGKSICLDTRGLTSFFFARFDRRLFDLLVVAAAIEFCDRAKRRPSLGWSRAFDVRIAVHEPEVWAAPEVTGLLQDALSFLTGDVWRFHFDARLNLVRRQPISFDSRRQSHEGLTLPCVGLDTQEQFRLQDQAGIGQPDAASADHHALAS